MSLSYSLAYWLYERGVIALRGVCGVISPEWFAAETAYQIQLFEDHLEAEDQREQVRLTEAN